jgi:hypothetical protein
MRACLLATRLARIEGLREPEAAAVYTTTLLRFVGCTATSLEYAQAFGGDDVAVRGRGDQVDATLPAEALGLLWGLGDGLSPLARVRLLAHALPRAKRVTGEGVRADCEVAASMARRFGLDEAVEAALWATFERWDGHGGPNGLPEDQIPLAARFAAVAYTAVIFAGVGAEVAVETVRRWSGRILDPGLAGTFASRGRELLEELERIEDLHVAVVAAEPGLRRTVTERQLDQVARGFADAVDLKSPYCTATPRAWPSSRRRPPASWGCGSGRRWPCAAPACSTTSAGPVSRPGCGTSRGHCRAWNDGVRWTERGHAISAAFVR